MITITAKKLLSWITVIILGSGGSALWVHGHSAKLQLSNKGEIKQLVMGGEINREIRALENRCHDLRMDIERKRSDLLRVQLNAGQGVHIIELRNRLENEIEDSQRDLDRMTEQLHDEETREQELIDTLHAS